MKKHKLKGYTLVELIVVIAIIGILSTVAMPNMVRQVGKSKFDTAQNQATAIFNAAQTVVQKYEVIDRAMSPTSAKLFDGTHTCGNISGVIFTDKLTSEFYTKLKALNTHLDNGAWGVVVVDYKVTHVFYSDSENDKYVGGYCNCIGNVHSASDYDSYDKSKNIVTRWGEVSTMP